MSLYMAAKLLGHWDALLFSLVHCFPHNHLQPYFSFQTFWKSHGRYIVSLKVLKPLKQCFFFSSSVPYSFLFCPIFIHSVIQHWNAGQLTSAFLSNPQPSSAESGNTSNGLFFFFPFTISPPALFGTSYLGEIPHPQGRSFLTILCSSSTLTALCQLIHWKWLGTANLFWG